MSTAPYRRSRATSNCCVGPDGTIVKTPRPLKSNICLRQKRSYSAFTFCFSWMQPSLHVQHMELTPLRRDAEPLMHSHSNASENKDNQYEFGDTDIQPGRNSPKSFKERFVGWRRTLLLGCVISVVVLLFNLGFTLWAVQHRHVQDGQGVLYEGDCKKVRNAGVGFHLIINILSTALLSASNYCMVCLRHFS